MGIVIPIDRALVETTEPTRTLDERVRFCSRCGAVSDDPELRTETTYRMDRVCNACGMGVLLTTSRELLASATAVFMVATRDLSVTAVSEAAESLFGEETGLIGAHLLSLISSPLGDEELVAAVARAAAGIRGVTLLPVFAVSPEARRRGPLEARIGTCGPPRAALVVLSRPAPGGE
jgi:ribosomal protein S27AE